MDVKGIKKIDIHVHATAYPSYSPKVYEGTPKLSAEQIIEIYDKLNVEKGVLMSLVSPESSSEIVTSADVKSIADKYPDRFLWFMGLDPRMCGNSAEADLSKHINYNKELGAKGIGELTAHLYCDHPMMDNLFYHASLCDMPVTIHIAPGLGKGYGIVDDLGLPRLEKMLKKHKNLKILGHSQCFWSEISSDITEEYRNRYPKGKVTEGRIANLMRDYEGLYCDFSAGSGLNAFTRDPEYTARFIEEFSDRILLGYDMVCPLNTHQYKYDDFLLKMIDDGYLTPENYYKLVRGNAIKLLKL
ncbi:MAG: amidohydrolase family protein [Clostridia bacterium]|nr:amidohydrolase family protein [Clostridia bacterium]